MNDKLLGASFGFYLGKSIENLHITGKLSCDFGEKDFAKITNKHIPGLIDKIIEKQTIKYKNVNQFNCMQDYINWAIQIINITNNPNFDTIICLVTDGKNIKNRCAIVGAIIGSHIGYEKLKSFYC